ncbi:MAG: glycosyltransferase [Pseudomonadota bacterium]
MRPTVAFAVPVWNGADFVAETLERALAQEGVRIAVCVSVDGGDAVSARACETLLPDRRLSIVVQQERLGWVRNSGAALDLALATHAPYVAVLPHDDLIAPDYAAALVAEIGDAAVAYPDVVTFGGPEVVVRMRSVLGSAMERQEAILSRCHAALPYRGLIRVSAMGRVPRIPQVPPDDFAADTVWMARLAREGELVRVPGAGYEKRVHGNNTHSAWFRQDGPARVAAWSTHCRAMLTEALPVARNAAERDRLIALAHARLVAPQMGPFRADIEKLDEGARDALGEAFLADFHMA